VTEGIRVLGEFISRKQTNLSALTSIVEVKVETALVSEEKQGKSKVSEYSGFFLTFSD
jgi:jagged-like protein